MNRTLSTPDGLLPVDSPNDPWSIVLLLDPRINGSPTRDMFHIGDTANYLSISKSSSNVRISVYTDGVQRGSVLLGAENGALSLVEITKTPDGVLDVVVNGALVGEIPHPALAPEGPVRVGSSDQYGQFYMPELLIIDGELTEAQKTQIRKALKALYPMSRHEVT